MHLKQTYSSLILRPSRIEIDCHTFYLFRHDILGLIAHEGTSNEQFLHLKNAFVYPNNGTGHHGTDSYYGALAIIETEQDYEFDKYEESPPCLEETFNDINNEEVFWQGFGQRIDESQGKLKDEKVLKLSNDACTQWIQHNSTVKGHPKRRGFRLLVRKSLDRGITDEILCTASLEEEFDGETFWNARGQVWLIS